MYGMGMAWHGLENFDTSRAVSAELQYATAQAMHNNRNYGTAAPKYVPGAAGLGPDSVKRPDRYGDVVYFNPTRISKHRPGRNLPDTVVPGADPARIPLRPAA